MSYDDVGIMPAAGSGGSNCGDMIDERLAQARSFGCETIDLKKSASLADQIEAIWAFPRLIASIDCVGSKPEGTAGRGVERPATVLRRRYGDYAGWRSYRDSGVST